ncbi:MAG: HNH endonuclease [Methanobrevibacter sp.]|nr:HNH endonuclease [Methanobrevibacter sp.]
MNICLKNTPNNTLMINYQTENTQQEIENKIWEEREEYMNKIFSPDLIFREFNRGNDVLARYDKQTHHIQHKTDYKMQWKLNQLINELKALTPLYADYTIISVDYRGMYYDCVDAESTPIWLYSATDEDCMDDISYLITQPFTELIKLLEQILKIELFCIYNFTLELLPNKAKKSKRQRTHVPKGMRHEVFKRDNYTCVECGARKDDGATLHVDHVVPVSKGGSDELDNLQNLCSDCNLNKSNIIQR